MSEAEAAATDKATFSARTVLALVLVGLLSFSGLAVLSAYAPDLRAGSDKGAHALSSSAVGYRGMVILMKAMGVEVDVLRRQALAADRARGLVVLTPDPRRPPPEGAVGAAPRAVTLIVLPKWETTQDPVRPGRVRKAGVIGAAGPVDRMLENKAGSTIVVARKGSSRAVLRAAADGRMAGAVLALGEIDRLQTVRGPGWAPVLTDETGGMVLARARGRADVYLLAEPDLLNNQGIAQLANARAGAAVINALRDDRPVLMDVTLNGLTRGQSIGRLMLEPPWIAATLCAVAAAVLMGLHALARFGQPLAGRRAFALGKAALVDNSAGLIRMARRETEMGAFYVALTKALIARAAGTERADDTWLGELARLRGAAGPAEIIAALEQARTREELTAAARRLYDWRLEMTRERR
jgi:hypothetical protein